MKREPRQLRWGLPTSPVPKHPYRDTALVYGFFSVLVVVIAWATGGPVLKAVALAAAFFVAAVAWSWWRWYQRVKREVAEANARDELL